ncbi:intestinal mucin-like protein isoform 1-T1 [Synchiropus picturatus]
MTTTQPSGSVPPPSGTTMGTTPIPSITAPSSTPETPLKSGPCTECYCGPRMDPETGLNIISCKPIVCDTTCSEGYEYEPDPDMCCGKCVQKSCVVTAPDNSTLFIRVNETYVSPDDPCVKYTCDKIGDTLMTTEIVKSCPPFNPDDCEPGTETTDADGCCKSCKQRSVCEVKTEEIILETDKCRTTVPVTVTSCAGHCGSTSIYSAAANSMMHQCECCQEDATSQRQVEMTCEDGTKIQHTYTVVESCRCTKAECVPGTTARPRRRRR